MPGEMGTLLPHAKKLLKGLRICPKASGRLMSEETFCKIVGSWASIRRLYRLKPTLRFEHSQLKSSYPNPHRDVIGLRNSRRLQLPLRPPVPQVTVRDPGIR